MGLKSWLIKHFFNKDIPADRIEEDLKNSKFNQALDEYLVTSQKRHQDTLRTADKLLKGKLLQQQSKEIISDIQDLDAEKEIADQPTMEDTITAVLLKNILGGPQAPPKPLDPFDDPNQPPALPAAAESAVPPKAEQSNLRQAAQEKIKNLSEQELKDLKNAGFI